MPENSWQYVTIPIVFDGSASSINLSEMKLTFEGLSDNKAEIADLRIAVGNSNKLVLDGGDFENAVKIGYTQNDTDYEKEVNLNMFMTESDLFLTHKNIYHMKEQSQSYYDLVLCGGTKVISVSQAWFIERSKSNRHYFSVFNDGIVNYISETKTRTANKKWCVTENKRRFHYDADNEKYYHEQKTSVDYTDNFEKGVNDNNSSTSYVWTNENGTPRAVKDAYKIITENFYDSYGNIEYIKIFNESDQKKSDTDPSAEKIIRKITYSTSTAKDRENPLEIIENETTQKVTFNSPLNQINTSQIIGGYPEGHTKKYNYNSFEDRMTSVSAIGIAANNNYNYVNGRLESIWDQNSRKFYFNYNEYGDTNKFYAGNTMNSSDKVLLLEKEISRGQANDIITQKRYRAIPGSNLIDKNVTIIDKYGRVKSQTNNTDTDIAYKYQDEIGDVFVESLSAAKIVKISDPYDGQNYTYSYNEENLPCGYSTSGNDSTKAPIFDVQQIGPSETKYLLGTTKRTSAVAYEDSELESGKNIYIEPRIRRTKDTDEYFDDDEKNSFEFTYGYDKLGRLKKSEGAKLVTKRGLFSIITGSSKQTMTLSYKPKTFLIDKLEHKTVGEESDTGILYGSHSATITQNYDYDARGNINVYQEGGTAFKKIMNCGSENYATTSIPNKYYTYKYDEMNRLTEEKDEVNDKYIKRYFYDGGLLKYIEIIKNGITTNNEFSYDDNGKRIKFKEENSSERSIGYDTYGNVTDYIGTSLTWNNRNLLEKYGTTATYSYNHQNIRYKKITRGITKSYFLDGSRILGENWNGAENNTRLRYFYDAQGIAGLRYCHKVSGTDTLTNYNFMRDILGNVSKIFYLNKLLAEYNYDAWGNCEIKYYDDLTNEQKLAINNNPFRWKGVFLIFFFT